MAATSKYTLIPSLKEKFDGIIWRIEIDEEARQVAIETRKTDSKEVRFSVFGYESGECYLKNFVMEQKEFWSMDRLYRDTLLLFGYLSDNSPEHKGICAVDIKSGDVKWQNYQMALEDLSTEGLVVYNPLLFPKKLQFAEVETGIVKGVASQEYPPITRNINFPEIAESGDLLPAFLPNNIIGPIHHANVNQKDVWSFHTADNGIYNQVLVIAEGGLILLEDIMSNEIQKLNPEAFFIQQNHLFYVRDSNKEIVSYLL